MDIHKLHARKAKALETAPCTVLGISWNFKSRKMPGPSWFNFWTANGPSAVNKCMFILKMPTTDDKVWAISKAGSSEGIIKCKNQLLAGTVTQRRFGTSSSSTRKGVFPLSRIPKPACYQVGNVQFTIIDKWSSVVNPDQLRHVCLRVGNADQGAKGKSRDWPPSRHTYRIFRRWPFSGPGTSRRTNSFWRSRLGWVLGAG